MDTLENSGKRKQTLSCGCLIHRTTIENKLEILLVKPFSKKDMWGVPKGHINPGETPEECAIREVLEETGIAVKIVGTELQLCHTKNGYENKTVRTFIAVPSTHDHTITGDGENAEMGWFPVDLLPTIHKYQVDMISDGVTRLVTMREQSKNDDI